MLVDDGGKLLRAELKVTSSSSSSTAATAIRTTTTTHTALHTNGSIAQSSTSSVRPMHPRHWLYVINAESGSGVV
jgi:DNA integrity scanning protein DisA with diadenylate cyclase activity